MKELVRIANADLEGKKQVYYGLTKIHGVSYSYSNAVCSVLNIDKAKKIGELSESEIKQLEETIRNPASLPSFLYNRRKDVDEGKDTHLTTSSLKLKIEFDIKRMKRLKVYRGIRHSQGQPVRGQRTKSHFRTGSSVGVMKRAAKIAVAKSGKPAEEKKK